MVYTDIVTFPMSTEVIRGMTGKTGGGGGPGGTFPSGLH